MIYCKPAEDVLPHPEACLVTGIAPQKAESEGLVEAEFIARIHEEFSQPGTCGVGYNSIRFDDEVTRYTLYRNFYDPYEREWANGNSRWDIIDMMRCCYALRPEGIEWPIVDDRPSFKLENLSAANGVLHEAAHDAFSDVEATIDMARLVKNKQPALFNHLYQHRIKHKNAAMIDLINRKPFLHISSRFPVENACSALVMPLAMHPKNKNAVIVFNLSHPAEDLINLDAEAIAERVFSAEADLDEGVSRIPLKLIHLNKSPVMLTPKFLDEKTARRLNINLQSCEENWKALKSVDLSEKVQSAMTMSEFPPREDVERQLYDGFISRADKSAMAALRDCSSEQLVNFMPKFSDKRLNKMVLRYKARNYPSALTEVEKSQWFEFCRMRLAEGEDGVLSVSQLQRRIREIDEQQELSKDKKVVLQQLFRYSQDLANKYQLGAKCSW